MLGGALAISALAGSMLLEAAVRFGVSDAVRTTLHLLTWWLACAAAVAYVPLAVAEVLRPRPRFDMRRWPTVFPLGMAGLTSLHLARVFHEDVLWDLGQVVSWLALAVWSVVVTGSLRRAWSLVTGRDRRG